MPSGARINAGYATFRDVISQYMELHREMDLEPLED
jgi:hypothetical protein